MRISTEKRTAPQRGKSVMVYGNRRSLCDSASRAQRTELSSKHARYRGIGLVWTAIFLMLMILLMGLSLDTGKVAYNMHQLQNAADAAALAGAQVVKIRTPDGTRQRTHDLGFANAAEGLAVTLRMNAQDDPFPMMEEWQEPFVVDPDLDIILGRWVRYNHKFMPTLDAPNAVMAIPRRNTALGATAPGLRLVFGESLAGADPADVLMVAVAWAADSGGAGLICLSQNAVPGLLISGTADLDIDGGGIHVNSTVVGNNNKDGTWISGNALLDAGFINVAGGISPDPDDPAWLGIFEGGSGDGYSVRDGDDGVEPIPDPLAAILIDECHYVLPIGDHLDLPNLINNGSIPPVTQTLEGTPITDTIITSCTLGPGYYPYGLSISNGVNVTLVPTSESDLGTIFVFGGGDGNPRCGLVMTGGSLTGDGVTCYVTQNFSNGQPGEITKTGGALDLASPGDWRNQQDGNLPGTEIYNSLVQGLNGIAVWQDPTMVDSKGDHPEVHLNGNGDFSIAGTLYFPDPIHARLEGDLGNTGNQILCGSAEIHGTATLTVNYDRRNQPGLLSHVFLVK